MIKKITQNYWEVFTIFLLSLTPLLWLRHGEVILGHDSGMRLDPMEYLKTLWYSWDPRVNFGFSVSHSKGFLISQLPEAVFVKLTGSVSLGQTMSFVFWFFVIGISMYLLIKRFFPERDFWGIRICAAVFYMYNFFLLQGWFITERAKFSLFAALPLLFLICWDTLEKNYSILKGSILFAGVLFFLNGGGSPPMYGGILVTLGVTVVFFIIRDLLRKSWRGIARTVLSVCSFIVITALVNAYWLVPQFYNAFGKYQTQLAGVGGINGILAWEQTISQHVYPLNLFRLQGIPDWYENTNHPYSHRYLTHPLLIVLSFIPIISVIFVLLKRNLWVKYERQLPFLLLVLLIFLIGIIFSGGSNPPFGFIYVLFLRYMPGFAIFRSALYKFGSSVWFSAIILFSASFFIIIHHYIRQRVAYFLSSIFIITLVLFYHFPYFTVDFFRWSPPFTTKVTLPGYVKDMMSYINAEYENEDVRILLLPPLDSQFSADSYRWGFWSLDILTRLGTNASIIASDADIPIMNALFDAATTHNSLSFYSILKRVGVQKILWRGDVLYPDKQTTSNNFSFIRDELLQMPEISREKEIGDWTLYNVESASPQAPVRIEPILIKASVDVSKLESLYKMMGSTSSSMFLTGLPQNVNLEKDITPIADTEVVSAICLLCNLEELLKIENSKDIQYIRLLPDSPFYPYILFKERSLLRSYNSIPPLRIDANLGLAMKRLAEIRDLYKRDIKDNTVYLTQQTITRFKKHVEDAIAESHMLSDIDRNIYRARIRANLKFYTKYLSEEIAVAPKEMAIPLYEYLENKMELFSEGAIDILDEAQYFLTIPTDGTYKLLVLSDRIKPSTIFLDNNELTNPDSEYITQGGHKLTLRFAAENLLSTTSSVSADINLLYGEQKRFRLSQTLYQSQYILQFDYMIKGGNNIYVSYHQDNDVIDDATGNVKRVFSMRLVDDGKWHTVRTIIRPNFGAKTGEVIFFTANTTDNKSQVVISNMKFQNIRPPEVFAIKKNEVSLSRQPEIVYKKITPSVRIVSIADAREYFLLSFSETYDKDWEAFIVPFGSEKTLTKFPWIFSLLSLKSVDEKEHFILDEYKNAWRIDKAGTYDIVLIYRPYLIFLISVGMSLVAISLSFVLLATFCRRKGDE